MRYFITTTPVRPKFGRVFYKYDSGCIYAKLEFNDNDWSLVSANIHRMEERLRKGEVIEIEPAEAALLFGEL